ncbi:MAG TPA: hypothetical protein VFE51_24440 [Verrucomicrobiae bacterium]|nr:hypothetical protein [Verrucomicrobiae bacterium]
MKPKQLSLPVAALLALGGLWFASSAWHTPAFHESNRVAAFETTQVDQSSMNVGSKRPTGRTQPGQMLRPPEPNRRFTDFTPEQRVEFARKGHGPGG